MSTAHQSDFDELERVVARSGVVRVLTGTAEWLRGVAQRSATLSATLTVRRQLQLLSGTQIIRGGGILLATFAVTQAVFAVVVPIRSAAAVPAAAWLVVAAGALWVIASARPLSIAWRAKKWHRDLPAGVAAERTSADAGVR